MLTPDELRHSQNSQALTSGAQAQCAGLTVMGTESGCGKTVVMTGIAHILNRTMTVRAIKPICSGPRERAEAEISFISSISGTPRGYAFSYSQPVPALPRLSRRQWQTGVSTVLSALETTFVECFQGAATPVFIEEEDNTQTVLDSMEFAVRLGFPLLLVAKHKEDAPEKLIYCAGLARSRGLDPLASVTVETLSGEGKELENKFSRQEVEHTILMRTKAPYLGCIKYSPSINVHRANQGNLVKMTEGGLDLLTLYREMERRGIALAI